jgi:Cu+-exporting ATPase
MSIMVGVGRGAQEGVLVKDAEALERLEKVTTLVVDKTGTLTEGKPKLMDVLPASGFGAKEFLRLAASLEQNSEHPLAAAIVRGAKDQGLALEAAKDFRSVTAGGVLGTVAGRAVLIGKPNFLWNEKITGLESLEVSAVKLQEEGRIAMGTGTDVAMQSAGITLVKGDLRGIVKAVRLSRATMCNIRQNLFFAFLYNALGIPVAAGVLYPFFGLLLSPVIAGAAMSLSSVSVISNVLQLRKVRL